uniref:Uncharacterized protein n=1 Tax=Lotharella globosa TaxID=91324 RepID=A0A6U3D2E8_9EUKA|mmetsp:Transcript_37709/g.73066  ORF Transcript_37709/g.73066 Transcript_37709/m.73066 type:complete len:140 (+) Transcript_37709:61-480(+)
MKKNVQEKLEVSIEPPKTERPEPDFKIRLPWENRANDSKEMSKSIPKTGRPRPHRNRRSKKITRKACPDPKSESKSKSLLNIPVNNPDLPRVLERDNSFMLPADHPDVQRIFGQFRGAQLPHDPQQAEEPAPASNTSGS